MSAEINRRLDNIIRFGTIAEVDYATARARVKSGQILTDFLPFITLRAGTTKTWSPPTVGEQCVILASSGELTTACILVGLYTQNSPSHSPDVHVIEFADGAKIEYNQSSGALVVTGIKTAAITAANQINIDCPTVNIKGNVNIMGAITTADNGGAKGNISISGNVEVKGTVTAKGDVKAGTISLQNHTHQEQGDGNLTSKAK
nr:phage baseplate assembly protein V [uncultured Aggregatibacter sp.]